MFRELSARPNFEPLKNHAGESVHDFGPGIVRPPTKLATRMKTVALLAVPPVEELGLAGPLGVFAGVNRVLGPRGPAYRIKVVSFESGRKIAGECGMSLVAHGHYKNLKHPIDTLIVAGSMTSRTKSHAELLTWLREMSKSVRRLASVCGGAFFLAEAGLLDGKRTTTHWALGDEFKSKDPDVKLDANPIWIKDGNLYTSAGVTAGIDLALAMVEEDHGAAIALDVGRRLLAFPHRPGSHAQLGAGPLLSGTGRRTFRELQSWILENLRQDLKVETLAARVAMSPRNFSRVFTKEMGVTPAKFVERLRFEAARLQLEETNRAVKEIASSCGFSSSEIMRRAFLSNLQFTPSAYRSRFRARFPA
jgi:transcriptional regulator GlxA family with amidase domain